MTHLSRRTTDSTDVGGKKTKKKPTERFWDDQLLAWSPQQLLAFLEGHSEQWIPSSRSRGITGRLQAHTWKDNDVTTALIMLILMYRQFDFRELSCSRPHYLPVFYNRAWYDMIWYDTIWKTRRVKLGLDLLLWSWCGHGMVWYGMASGWKAQFFSESIAFTVYSCQSFTLNSKASNYKSLVQIVDQGFLTVCM